MTGARKSIKAGAMILIIAGILFFIYNVFGITGYKNMDPQMLSDLEKISHMDVSGTISRMTVQAVACGAQVVLGIAGLFCLKRQNSGKFCGLISALVILLVGISDVYAFLTVGAGFETYLDSFLALIAAILIGVGAYKDLKQST